MRFNTPSKARDALVDLTRFYGAPTEWFAYRIVGQTSGSCNVNGRRLISFSHCGKSRDPTRRSTWFNGVLFQ
jgi:hypothetical protein